MHVLACSVLLYIKINVQWCEHEKNNNKRKRERGKFGLHYSLRSFAEQLPLKLVKSQRTTSLINSNHY